MPSSLSERLNDPYLFEENQAGNYRYESNSVGGVTAYGSLKLSDSPTRNAAAQSAAGGDMRRGHGHAWGDDDGGHLIGARFGGDSGGINLSAQNRNLNRSGYKHLENEWAQHLENGDKVFVHIETDSMERPSAYTGYCIYESEGEVRHYDTFHLVNESSDEIARWEADAASEYLPDEDFSSSPSLNADEYASFDCETAQDISSSREAVNAGIDESKDFCSQLSEQSCTEYVVPDSSMDME